MMDASMYMQHVCALYVYISIHLHKASAETHRTQEEKTRNGRNTKGRTPSLTNVAEKNTPNSNEFEITNGDPNWSFPA